VVNVEGQDMGLAKLIGAVSLNRKWRPASWQAYEPLAGRAEGSARVSSAALVRAV